MIRSRSRLHDSLDAPAALALSIEQSRETSTTVLRLAQRAIALRLAAAVLPGPGLSIWVSIPRR
jgi:hypothetical protein